ncbi:MAG TPA: N-acetylmuramoyl-L-alanine amidase-like domain-containing protein [Chroococcales cyanobacterium]
MKKCFGLTVVGFAIASCGAALCASAFDVALRFASPATENHPVPVSSTFPKPQIRTYANPLNGITLPTTGILANPSIHPNPARSVEPALANIQTSDSALSERVSNLGKPYAQTPQLDIPPTKDGERFKRVMQYAVAQNLHQRQMGEIVQAIANQFLGAAYKANLLDQSQEETLVVTLNQFDCVLFVETVLAIARGVAVQDYSYPTFVNHLRDQRYRDGQMNGYCSRLHYFVDWISDNQKRGTVQNLAQQLGGVSLHKTLNFMTTHRQSSPQLVSDNANFQCIVQQEAQLDRLTIDYIPTNQIRHLYSQLQPGDIIAVATNIPGLDVTHTGLVYRQPNGTIGFIHASPAGQVTIARDLERYISRVNRAIGILVARPTDPR